MVKWIIIWLLFITPVATVHGQPVHVDIREWPPAGTLTPDTLYYSATRKLQWSDFRGTPRPGSPSAALSFTGFSYDASALQDSNSVRVTLYLQVYFDRRGSWVRPGEKNNYALSHEQLHFDIAKVAEEQFIDSVLTRTFSPAYYGIEIHFLYWDMWGKMNDMQQQFDAETRHGQDHGREEQWEQKIRRLLLSNSDPG
jgi:hypothetical protein